MQKQMCFMTYKNKNDRETCNSKFNIKQRLAAQNNLAAHMAYVLLYMCHYNNVLYGSGMVQKCPEITLDLSARHGETMILTPTQLMSGLIYGQVYMVLI